MNELSLPYLRMPRTQLFKCGENIDQVDYNIDVDLKKVDEWYELIEWKEIIENSQQLILEGQRVQSSVKLWNHCYVIPVQSKLELFVIVLISQLKFESQIRKACCKVVWQVAALIRWKRMGPFEMSLEIYCPFIAPDCKYCSEM